MNTNEKIRNFFNPNLNERLQSTETPSHEPDGDGGWNDEGTPYRSNTTRGASDDANEGSVPAFHLERDSSRLQIDYLRKLRLQSRFNKR